MVFKMKVISLNGVDFEVSRKALDIDPIRYMGRNLDECYEHPSDRKRRIWNEWVNYFHELTNPLGRISLTMAHPFVNSYNTNVFTIGCNFNLNGVNYSAKITPTHNYICVTSK